MPSEEFHREKYVYNMYGKVKSLTVSDKPRHVRITMQLDSTGVGDFVIDLPISADYLKNFIPGEGLRILIEKD